MGSVLLVAFGGALGATARYGVGLLALRLFGSSFPWGTLAVNVIGGLAMGALFAFHSERKDLVLLLGTGLMGGFTTFSAFSLETVRMLERGSVGEGLAYAAGSVVLSCMALWGGLALARIGQ